MRKRLLLIAAFLLLALPPAAWMLNRWTFTRWSQHILDVAATLRAGAPAELRECPSAILYAHPGEVRIVFEPPRTAWLARWNGDALAYNSYTLTLRDRNGQREVTIAHGSD